MYNPTAKGSALIPRFSAATYLQVAAIVLISHFTISPVPVDRPLLCFSRREKQTFLQITHFPVSLCMVSHIPHFFLIFFVACASVSYSDNIILPRWPNNTTLPSTAILVLHKHVECHEAEGKYEVEEGCGAGSEEKYCGAKFGMLIVKRRGVAGDWSELEEEIRGSFKGDVLSLSDIRGGMLLPPSTHLLIVTESITLQV